MNRILFFALTALFLTPLSVLADPLAISTLDPLQRDAKGQVTVEKRDGNYWIAATFKDQATFQALTKTGVFLLPLDDLEIFVIDRESGDFKRAAGNWQAILDSQQITTCSGELARAVAYIGNEVVGVRFGGGPQQAHQGGEPAFLACDAWSLIEGCSNDLCTRCYNCSTTRTRCSTNTTCTEGTGFCMHHPIIPFTCSCMKVAGQAIN